MYSSPSRAVLDPHMTNSVLKIKLLVGALATGMTLVSAAATPPAKPLMSVPQPVRDLYYGDALFYFYQDDFFQSLVRLDAATQLGRVPHHQTESELLKGALYLSLGQHIQAGKIFQTLLNDNVDATVRNRAWFYLAKIWYQRGYWKESEQALQAIDANLPESLEPERRLMQAQVLMNQERYDDAIAQLQMLDGSKQLAWQSYARFNLGVALIRQEKTQPALALLERVGTQPADSEELRSLRDKANLALGFTLLKLDRMTEAEQVLQRIRLNGPLSNKALLGLGWAQSSSGRFNEALVSWQELKQRDLLDAAVQESYLAIPYAYAKLGAEVQATEFYTFAIDAFRSESGRLDESITAIQKGSLLQTVLENDATDQSGWYWQLRNLPDAPETRYLYDLLASNSFQEALKNYRDLRAMQRNLDNWLESVVAFDDMIATRKLAYDQRVSAMQAALDDVDVDAIEAQTTELEARVSAVARDEDVVALATPEEQQSWQRIRRVEAALQGADGSDAATEEMRDKVRLMRGALYWNMNSNYKARLWSQQKQVKELAVATKEARRRHTLVERARTQVPLRNDEFSSRVATLKPQLEALLKRCDVVGQSQRDYLSALAVTQLQEQKQRLSQYALQAQFALASIYDRASSSAAVPVTATSPDRTADEQPATEVTP